MKMTARRTGAHPKMPKEALGHFTQRPAGFSAPPALERTAP